MIDRAAPLRAAMLQLAEASALYSPLGAGEALIESARCVLFFGNADHEGANCVQRLRLGAAEVEATRPGNATVAR